MRIDRPPAEGLDLTVEGRNLRPGALADQLGPGPTLLVFLRHFGCMFCREMVRDLREQAGEPRFPRVVLVHQGERAEGHVFFNRLWPDVSAVADPGGRLYRAFGVARGNVAQMFGPRAAACAVRAAAKGNGVGRRVGDGWTLPTLFLMAADGTPLWEHRGVHSGHHPDWRLVRAVAAAA